MRSAALSSMPSPVKRSLSKLGRDIATSRRKRALTAMMMAERAGVAKSTYLRVEKGDPSVSIGVYAMALFALGLGNVLDGIADPGRDDAGLLLDQERLPKRVRPRKAGAPL